MPEEIVMPRLSDTMEEGTIAQWLKQEGDTVHRGEIILEVETDKATMPLEAYSEGVLQKILQPAGTTVPLGTVIGLLAKPGETSAPASGGQPQGAGAATRGQAANQVAAAPATQEAPRGTREQVAGNGSAAEAPAAQVPGSGGGNGNVPPQEGNGAEGGENAAGSVVHTPKASPLARNLARQHNIDLVALGGQGSGPGGRIVKIDIERFMAQQPAAIAAPAAPAEETTARAAGSSAPAPTAAAAPAAGDVELRTPNRFQAVAARRLLESKTTVPHFYVTNEVDMAAAAELRQQLVASLGDEGKVTYNHLIIRACALALHAMPEVNTSWRDGQFAVHKHVNVGMAVDTPNGLLVPVIRDADRKGLREIAAEARDLATKARDGKLTPTEMSGGTFTVSTLGMFDVEEFQAIINPPESAILAVGSIMDKPAVMDGQVVVRPRMKLTLSVDHRVVPGAPAAQFLQKLKQLLQEPLRLGF